METASTCLLEVTVPNCPNQKQGQKRLRKARALAARLSYLWCEAEHDLGQISLKYGADLMQVLVEWRDLQNAHSLLTSLRITVLTVSGARQVLASDTRVFFLEICVGC